MSGECAFCAFYLFLLRKMETEPRDDQMYRAHLDKSHGWKPESLAMKN